MAKKISPLKRSLEQRAFLLCFLFFPYHAQINSRSTFSLNTFLIERSLVEERIYEKCSKIFTRFFSRLLKKRIIVESTSFSVTYFEYPKVIRAGSLLRNIAYASRKSLRAIID